MRGDFAEAVAEGARAGGVADVHVMQDHEALAEAIAAAARPGDALLVKGSRGMRMEKIIELLTVRFAEPTQPRAVNRNG